MKTTEYPKRPLHVVALIVAIVSALLGAMARPASAGLSPGTATFTVNPGGSVTENKTVTVPARPPKADIEIAIDTTGSMAPAISQAKAQATNLVNEVKAEIPDAQFAVVDFRDSTDGPAEYQVRTPMTGTAATVQAAINTMSAGGGGDFPEAYNLVFNKAYNPLTAGAIGWRSGSRKFVVVIGDAPPHGAVPAGYSNCFDSSPDPHGFNTATELKGLAAAQRTLFMVATNDSIKRCYDQLVVGGFSGSASVKLGSSFSKQIVDLIKAASATVENVHLEVASASPAPASPSWISFSPGSVGPVSAPSTQTFTLTAAVPVGTPGGTYNFDIVALADGADIGHQTLTLVVPDVKIAINDVTVVEGDSGSTPATFTVNLSPAPTQPVSVKYATASGTATAGADYITTSGTLSFAAGESSKAVSVPVLGDVVNEPNETFFVDLSNPVNATIADSRGVGTIIDDDRDGAFSCRATGLRLGTGELVVANPADSPCKDDHHFLAEADLGTVKAVALDALTDQTPDDLESTAPSSTDNGVAKATVSEVTIAAGPTVTIKATVIQSSAKVQCVARTSGLAPALSGSSSIYSLTVNGSAVDVSGSAAIIVDGVTILVNSQIITPTSLTQRALTVSGSLVSTIVVGEAKADFSGNPCAQ